MSHDRMIAPGTFAIPAVAPVGGAGTGAGVTDTLLEFPLSPAAFTARTT
jgi:hypothetical protein